MVNTFLPFPSFVRSAEVLDRARLGKQRMEVVQILRALHGAVGYKNHPAANMWRGYHVALVNYGIAICNEWEARGYEDTQRAAICEFIPFIRNRYGPKHPRELRDLGLLPWWFGWRHFHASHRSNLVRKDVDHYEWRFQQALGTGEPIDPSLPYVWPRSNERVWGEKHAGAHRRTWQWYYQPN